MSNKKEAEMPPLALLVVLVVLFLQVFSLYFLDLATKNIHKHHHEILLEIRRGPSTRVMDLESGKELEFIPKWNPDKPNETE